ncbi:hypothetical protein Bca4012_078243 [Brassica carinata]
MDEKTIRSPFLSSVGSSSLRLCLAGLDNSSKKVRASGGSGGGYARNPGMGPAGRTNSASSAASPTSSSSSVQQQQQQQLASRQQQQVRNSEANDGMFAYHAGGVQGMMGGGNFCSSSGSMQHPQQPRRLFDSPQPQPQQQQQGSSQEGQQNFNPMQQAYLQFALQAQQQKAQQQARMGMLGSSKDQDARMGPQQRNETKPHPQQVGTGQLMPGNIIRPMQAPQALLVISLGMSGSGKARHAISTFASTSSPRMMNPAANPFSAQGRDNPLYPRHLVQPTNGTPSGNSMQTSANETHVLDHTASTNKSLGSAEHLQMQQPRQLNAPSPKAALSDAGLPSKSSLQSGRGTKQAQQRSGFTKQQLHVFKAQILAFRRLKKGEGSLPRELFKSIAPPPLEIEQKKLRLSALQSRVKDEVDRQQQDIMSMPDRPYRKFVMLCE